MRRESRLSRIRRPRGRSAPLDLAAPVLLAFVGQALAAPSCPIEAPAIEAAKPNKLYLYFPTADDAGFPASGCMLGTMTCFQTNDNVKPLKAFDISTLTSYTGNVSDLRDRITDVVTDDYCEFNVKVIQTTSLPPTTFARRVTVGIGTDGNGSGLYGEAQEVDTGDAIGADYARVWALTYQQISGGPGQALNGANSTLERWAFSIGGTAAHEAGHTYGLTHANGETVLPGEDPVGTHIMPAGPTVTPEERAGSRRHFDDTSFGILAANVGLSVETIHNWDFTNPNSVDAKQIRFDLLSTQPTLSLSWSYGGNLSPWTAPAVSGPIGVTTFRGVVYNRFQVTWSTGKSWANGTPGTVPAGANFHVGAAFSNVDFTTPDPVIVVKVNLLDGSGNSLTLQPRMVGYDAGALDAADGTLRVKLFNVDNPARELQVRNLQVVQLPRVASIESMVAGARLVSWQGLLVQPWKTKRALPCAGGGDQPGCSAKLGRTPMSVAVATLAQGRHIAQRFDGACLHETPGNTPRDSVKSPDVNECPNAGFSLDLFPATIVYVTATIVDPAAQHWDVATKKMVVGPVTSRLFYQVAGRHPDLNRNGIDDYIDIATGISKDPNRTGVPGEVKPCRTYLTRLDAAELAEHNTRMTLMDAERRLKSCGTGCPEGKTLETSIEASRKLLQRQTLAAQNGLKGFRQCEAKNAPAR
jgi:hypothetical protein